MPRSRVFVLLLAVASLSVYPTNVYPQELVTLSPPTGVFSEPFSSVTGIRELSDGRLLVSDRIEQTISFVDLESGTAQPVGRVGAGPGEYRMPGMLLPLRADSTLLMDVGNMRMTVIGPNGITSQSIPLIKPNGQHLVPSRSDTNGVLFSESQSMWMFGPSSPLQVEEPDSIPITSWDLFAETVDTLCFLSMHGRERKRMRFGEADLRRFFPPAFPSRDGWTVAPDGRIALVYASDYHVEWVLPGGDRVIGPSTPYDPIPVNDEEKQLWTERVGGGTVLAVSGEPEGGALTQRMPTPSPDEINWPQFKPPFVSDLIFVAPDGNLWVGRHVAANDPRIFDVFDEEGKIVRSVVLPQGRRLVGFGSQSLYAVRTDDDDLLWLERYSR